MTETLKITKDKALYILRRIGRANFSGDNQFSMKIVSAEEAGEITEYLKKHGKKTVLVSGCFDVLHIGHFLLLEEARKFGDALVVAVATDEQIAQFKNSSRPINKLIDRMKMLSALEMVDYIFPQDSWLMMEVFQKVRPSVYAVWLSDEHMTSRLQQAEAFGIKLHKVDAGKKDISSTKILKALGIE